MSVRDIMKAEFLFEETVTDSNAEPFAVLTVQGDTVLGPDDMGDRNHVQFELENTGDVALNDFSLAYKPTSESRWHILATAGVNGNVLAVDGDPSSLASASSVAATVKFYSAYQIGFFATVASGTTTVALRGVVWQN